MLKTKIFSFLLFLSLGFSAVANFSINEVPNQILLECTITELLRKTHSWPKRYGTFTSHFNEKGLLVVKQNKKESHLSRKQLERKKNLTSETLIFNLNPSQALKFEIHGQTLRRSGVMSLRDKNTNQWQRVAKVTCH